MVRERVNEMLQQNNPPATVDGSALISRYSAETMVADDPWHRFAPNDDINTTGEDSDMRKVPEKVKNRKKVLRSGPVWRACVYQFQEHAIYGGYG